MLKYLEGIGNILKSASGEMVTKLLSQSPYGGYLYQIFGFQSQWNMYLEYTTHLK